MVKKSLPPDVLEFLDRARVIAAAGDAVTDADLVNFIRQGESVIASLDLHALARIPGVACLECDDAAGWTESLMVREIDDEWRLVVEVAQDGEAPHARAMLLTASRNTQLKAGTQLPALIETLAAGSAPRSSTGARPRIMGSKMEDDLRTQILATTKAVLQDPSRDGLVRALGRCAPDFKVAYVLTVVPDQEEDVLTLLVDRRMIVRLVWSRRSHAATTEKALPVNEYVKTLRGQVAHLRLAVAMDLSRGGMED